MPIPRKPELLLLCLFLVSGCVTPANDGSVATALATPQAASPAVSDTPPDLDGATATRPPADPDTLLGLEPRDVQAILGPVSLKRWEGDGQVMQYSNEQCVMDIYFYETTPGGAFQVTYLSARTTGGTDTDAALCLGSLMPN